jgi:hypothetical protein
MACTISLFELMIQREDPMDYSGGKFSMKPKVRQWAMTK